MGTARDRLGAVLIGSLVVSAGCAGPRAAVTTTSSGASAGATGGEARASVSPAADPQRFPDAFASLRVWEDTLAAAPVGALIPVASANRIENSVGDPATYALPDRGFDVTTVIPDVDLPAPTDPGGLPTLGSRSALAASWQPWGSGGEPLLNARAETLPMVTTVGVREVPVWRFDIDHSTVTLTAQALDPAYLLAPNGMPEPFPSSTSYARLIDDRTLGVTVAGAHVSCGEEYVPHAVEGVRAVAVAVETVRHPTSGSCLGSVQYFDLTMTLQEPLGDRVLVGVDGRPVFVDSVPPPQEPVALPSFGPEVQAPTGPTG